MCGLLATVQIALRKNVCFMFITVLVSLVIVDAVL